MSPVLQLSHFRYLICVRTAKGKVWGTDEVNVEGWKPLKRLPGHESGEYSHGPGVQVRIDHFNAHVVIPKNYMSRDWQNALIPDTNLCV